MIRQRLMLIVVAMLAALGLATVGVNPAAAAPSAQAAAPPITTAVPSVPVTGAFTDASGGVGSFVGSFTPTSFSAPNGNLVATGNLTGTLTDSAGSAVGTVSRSASMPVGIAQATCSVLNLTLGQLHLDLLGLVVDLNQVHLTINAVPGPGNLLGNLLCAITHLLDGTPTAGGLAALLNAILALLGQL
jgi:hypothetical protein